MPKPLTIAPDANMTAAEAVEYVARRYYSGRRRPHRGQVYRWIRLGLAVGGRRVKLEHERAGRTWLTRAAWIDQFFDELKRNGADTPRRPVAHPNRPTVTRTHAEAERALRAAGV